MISAKNALLWIHVYSPEIFKMSATFPNTILFCGCRPQYKKFLTVFPCDRVRTAVRPRLAALQKPQAGMVISGSGPNLIVELCARREVVRLP